jgi:Fe-S-cluster formation regulator IscX/YfhJ
MKRKLFLTDCQKKSKHRQIRAVGAELFHADGRTDGRTDRQTDMTKLIVAFRNFANAPKNDSSSQH